MIRRPLTVAAAGVAGLLGLAACGSDSSEPVVRAASPAPQAAFDVYYDLTHPDVVHVQRRAPESANQLEHRAMVAQQQRAPESVNQLEHRAMAHKRAPESVNQLEHRAQVVQEKLLQAQLAELAEEEGLTGLSPAFLQPIPQPIKR